MNSYFMVAAAIEQRVREMMPELDKVCRLFEANHPSELKNLPKTAHINMLQSSFGNHAGHGAKQTETQRWQVSLCLKAPATAAEEAVFIEDAGVLCLKLREALQGWKPTPSARGMVCTGYQPLLTQDCRWRIFSFVFESVVLI